METLSAVDYKSFFENGISYSTYKINFEEEMNSEEQNAMSEYLPQNWRRQSRLDRKLKLNDQLLERINNIKIPKKWLVITEHWCGDASQIIPIINKVAVESKGLIDLKFVYRDNDVSLIDSHLTDGRSRSIPILLELDEGFEFMKSYGPRPKEAQNLVKSLLKSKMPYSIPLHTWYAKDKQRSIQLDLINFLS